DDDRPARSRDEGRGRQSGQSAADDNDVGRAGGGFRGGGHGQLLSGKRLHHEGDGRRSGFVTTVAGMPGRDLPRAGESATFPTSPAFHVHLAADSCYYVRRTFRSVRAWLGLATSAVVDHYGGVPGRPCTFSSSGRCHEAPAKIAIPNWQGLP